MSDLLEWERSLTEKQAAIEKRIGLLNDLHSTLGTSSNLIEFGFENCQSLVRQQIDQIKRRNAELNEYADRIEHEMDLNFKILDNKINKFVNCLRYFQNVLENGLKLRLASVRDELVDEIGKCRENIRTLQSNQNECGEFEFDRLLEKSAGFLESLALSVDANEQRELSDDESLSVTNFLQSLRQFNNEFSDVSTVDSKSPIGNEERHAIDNDPATVRFKRCLDKLNDPSLYPIPLKFSSAYYDLTQNNDKENFRMRTAVDQQSPPKDAKQIATDLLLAKIKSLQFTK